MRVLVVGLVTTLLGCHAKLGGAPIDAAPDASLIDAKLCANGRVVYLDFEGAAVLQAPTDATLNHVQWLPAMTATIPPYKVGSATRAAEIQQLTTAITAQLAAFPVTVVTQRPMAGPYVMVIIGGAAADLGYASDYRSATNYDCGDAIKSDVVWVGDKAVAQLIANLAVGGIGITIGLTGTTTPTDCLCSWGNSCMLTATAACTLSTTLTSDAQCPGQVQPQDEPAAFERAFCKPLP
jgi:hypothetical protein